MNTYHITRIVKEEYSVEADSAEEALAIVHESGNPFSVTVQKETFREIPPPNNPNQNKKDK